jgi:hypothetical protein
MFTAHCTFVGDTQSTVFPIPYDETVRGEPSDLRARTFLSDVNLKLRPGGEWSGRGYDRCERVIIRLQENDMFIADSANYFTPVTATGPLSAVWGRVQRKLFRLLLDYRYEGKHYEEHVPLESINSGTPVQLESGIYLSVAPGTPLVLTFSKEDEVLHITRVL